MSTLGTGSLGGGLYLGAFGTLGEGSLGSGLLGNPEYVDVTKLTPTRISIAAFEVALSLAALETSGVEVVTFDQTPVRTDVLPEVVVILTEVEAI